MSKEKADKSLLQSDISKNKETFQRGTLLKIIQILSSSLDYQYILDNITSLILELLDSQGATIYLIDKTKKYLHPVKTSDPYNVEEVMSNDIIINKSLSGKVVKAKKGMIFKNAALNADAYQIPGTAADEDEHLIVFPLLIQNKVLGTLNLYRRNKIYSKEDLEFGEVFALYASMAIQNATEHQQLISEINERKDATEELEKSEEQFQSLFDSMREGFALCEVICDKKGIPIDYRFLMINPAFEQQSGMKASTSIGKTIKEIYPNIEQKWIDRYGRVGITQEAIHFVDYNHNTDKYYNAVAFSPSRGKFAMLFRDITKSKQTEDKIKFLSEITQQASDSVITTDLDFNITWVNDAFKKLFGYEIEEIIGKPPDLLNAEPLSDEIQKEIYKTVVGGNTYKGEALNIKKDGSVFQCEFSVFPMLDDKGAIIAYSGHQRDISERKQVEEKLISRNKELELFNEVTVGRELKMIDLKKEINELLEKSGEKPKYKIPI